MLVVVVGCCGVIVVVAGRGGCGGSSGRVVIFCVAVGVDDGYGGVGVGWGSLL